MWRFKCFFPLFVTTSLLTNGIVHDSAMALDAQLQHHSIFSSWIFIPKIWVRALEHFITIDNRQIKTFLKHYLNRIQFVHCANKLTNSPTFFLKWIVLARYVSRLTIAFLSIRRDSLNRCTNLLGGSYSWNSFPIDEMIDCTFNNNN